ncbi:MAG: RNA pseudouridine synthase [Thiotrichales bacterium]|nr:MAG: RNA pseudouridine synthase [Thiotrichales bacterium]
MTINNHKQEFHIEVTTHDKMALDYLAEASGLSRQKIKTVMQQGCVWLEQKNKPVTRLRRAKKTVSAGDILHFYYNESVLQQRPKPATLISDEGDYSVWDKPSGMFSQGSKWGDHCTIQRWAEKILIPERVAFVVHRLDRAANGLIILAHKKTVAAQFGQLFEQRKIIKRYQVLVEGHFLDIADNGFITIDNEIDGKKSISHVTVLKVDEINNRTLLGVTIETGRKHQIRKHLSGVGFPVVGDRLYGSGLESSKETDKDSLDCKNDLQLSAVYLSFVCPVTQQEKVFSR